MTTTDVNRLIHEIQRREKQQQIAQEQRRKEMAEIEARQQAREEAQREKLRERERQDAEAKRQAAEGQKLREEREAARERARRRSDKNDAEWRLDQDRIIPAAKLSHASKPPLHSTDPSTNLPLSRQSIIPTNISVDVSRPSPASSVSVAMSLSPDVRRPTAANKKRPRIAVAEKLSHDADADSSDDELAQSALSAAKRPLPLQSNLGVIRRQPAAAARHKHAPGGSKSDSSSSDEDNSHPHAKTMSKIASAPSATSQSGPPTVKRKLNFSLLLNRGDDSSSDEDSNPEPRRHIVAKSPTSLKSKDTRSGSSASPIRARNDDLPTESQSLSEKRRPRNPLFLMKDEQARTFSPDSKRSHTQPSSNSTASLSRSSPLPNVGGSYGNSRSNHVDRNSVDDILSTVPDTASSGCPPSNPPDDLWGSDDDAEAAVQQKAKEPTTKETVAGKTKVSTDKYPSDDATEDCRSKPVAVRSPHLLRNQPHQQDCESDEGSSDDYSVTRLHPHFEDPYFGPFDNEPLLLSYDQSEVTYEVPSSINRYLPNYQQDGIEFMFDRLMREGGAILGDDMGLGKTIQVVGLLAALLQKTGTGVDLREVRRRKSLVRQHRRATKSAEEDSVRQGLMPSISTPNLAPEVGAPVWSPILLVVPKNVLEQWLDAMKQWGFFAVDIFHSDIDVSGIRMGEFEILVCKHSHFSMKKALALLLKVPWKLVIIDEFHIFKNEKSKWAMHLRALREKVPGFLTLGLTGTLMQNKHEELWNLVDLVCPNFLGRWSQFNAEYATPIKRSEKKDADMATKELGRQKSKEFKNSILPKVFLQRFKEEVLHDHLPTKDEKIVLCELSDIQKKVYKHILKQPDFVLVSQANGPCACSNNYEFFRQYKRLPTLEQRMDYLHRHRKQIRKRGACHHNAPWDPSSPDGFSPRAVLWRQLRMHQGMSICEYCPWCLCFPTMGILYKLVSHVSLLQASEDPMKAVPGTAAHANAVKEFERAQAFLPVDLVQSNGLPVGYIRENTVMDSHFELSGKMKMLGKLLERIHGRNGRVLVFSAYTTTLSLIENFVRMKYKYLRMDGTTSLTQRKTIIHAFKSDANIFVFLLSTRAMGLGLNLTEANNVIIYDVEWNPSWDAQAQDRAFRIGQEQDVKVYRLVARGTLEEMKYLRQVYKNQLKDRTITVLDEFAQDSAKKEFRGVANDKDNKGELFGMANLLKFRDGTFMKYGSSSSYQNKDGVEQVGVADILATMNVMEERDRDQLLGLGSASEIDELTGLEEVDIPDPTSDDEGYDINVGAESQVNIGICEGFQVDGSDAEPIPATTNAPYASEPNNASTTLALSCDSLVGNSASAGVRPDIASSSRVGKSAHNGVKPDIENSSRPATSVDSTVTVRSLTMVDSGKDPSVGSHNFHLPTKRKKTKKK